MNKKNFNVVGNNETENQELAKGIAFIKSRRAELNVVQMVENMRDQAMPNGQRHPLFHLKYHYKSSPSQSPAYSR